jgi:hypothetical protein
MMYSKGYSDSVRNPLTAVGDFTIAYMGLWSHRPLRAPFPPQGRASGQNGIVYAAPTLICHYGQRHGYCPPAEFLEALRNYG